MKDILESLYLGEVQPFERPLAPGEKESIQNIVQLEEQLHTILSKKDQELLHQFIAAVSESSSRDTVISFSDGFCLGARLMIAVFTK